jgi:hypothetical protein
LASIAREMCLDDAVARGKAGEATFFASENGRTVGTRAMDCYNVWVAGHSVRERHYFNGCDRWCVGTPTRDDYPMFSSDIWFSSNARSSFESGRVPQLRAPRLTQWPSMSSVETIRAAERRL